MGRFYLRRRNGGNTGTGGDEMIVRINGKVVAYDLGLQLPALEIETEEARKIDRFLGHLKRNQRAYTAMAAALALMLEPTGAFAATGMSGGKNIILLLQKASFWVGMGITIWGIVEAQLDFPGWKGRILKGILGYIGILLVPLVFLELQASLQVDVWQQIDQGGGTP
jgi:hypothetical protein